jgi:hypothetical protein
MSEFTYELEPRTAELLNLIANISHVGKLHDVMQLEKKMKFTYEFEPETGELLIFWADISLFINEDYEGNKYPEVEYDNQKLWLHLWSNVLDEVVEIPLEIDGDVFNKYIKDNKELEQAALKQLIGDRDGN